MKINVVAKITDAKMLSKGLNGYYVMISGNAMCLQSPTIESYVKLPYNVSWKGTIIALRIPYINENFNYINYIESELAITCSETLPFLVVNHCFYL